MEFEEAVKTVIWKDVEGPEDFPTYRPLLSHYTSVATLDAIMGNDEIWFSNPLYMNDLEELRFGMIQGATVFRHSQKLRNAFNDEQSYDHLIRHFNTLAEMFETKLAYDVYVMCFAEHQQDNNDGLLSMWRGYGAGGGGVAIVIDTKKISFTESSPLIIGAVKYATQQSRIEWIENSIAELANVIAGRTLSEDELAFIAFHWIERLKIFALFTKHIGFHEEKEWRVVYMSGRDSDDRLKGMLGYTITPKGSVEPKLKFQVKPLGDLFGDILSLDHIIDRIILGPTTSTVLATTSVKRMLSHHGKSSIAKKVVGSTIPFRL
jgi:hypothetical protein